MYLLSDNSFAFSGTNLNSTAVTSEVPRTGNMERCVFVFLLQHEKIGFNETIGHYLQIFLG